ncbi:P-loop NTPase [Oceaniglobus indicus]|uniref:P-loop NTPase n=1 Tax=Oceaniglobus indicus TaxID=2047749 RepID=UPI001F4EAAB1|nr:P-loop NTPase [Oceaniglobus indicus]
MGVSARPVSTDGDIVQPVTAHGATLMSIGLMPDQAGSVIRRGPMGALQQMPGQVAWGALDVLLVDLPSETYGAPLTICQRYAADGVLMVSTPQDVALLDAHRPLDTPVLALVANMSAFTCPHCDGQSHIFGGGGIAAEAQNPCVPLLAALPLTPKARLAKHARTPVALCGDAETGHFGRRARDLMGKLAG